MAYPVSAPSVRAASETLDADLEQVRAACQAVQAATNGGAQADLWYTLNVTNACRAYRTDLAVIRTNDALWAQLVPYIQSQKAGATALSVQQEFINLNTLTTNLLSAFQADYPHNAQGVLLDRTYSLANGETWLKFTAAQAPNFMAAVTALLSALT